jgi:ankyrin repeat protein
MTSAQVNTELFHTCRTGDIETVRVLLERGADIEARDSDNWTPLHVACAWGHLAVTRLLLDAGADMNVRDNDGHAPLNVACIFHNARIIRLLLERGVDVNIRDNWGKSPLDRAMDLPPTNPAREEIIDLFREFHPELVIETYCRGPRL